MSTSGIPAARARLAQLAEGLRAAASGEVVRRAAAKVQAQISAVSQRILSKHVLSGRALTEGNATASGGLIQLSVPEYVGFGLRSAWPFRSGMPPFVIARATKIFAAELAAALAGERSPIEVEEELAEEKAAEKSRAKFRRDVARIYRQSAEGRAARRAARKAARG